MNKELLQYLEVMKEREIDLACNGNKVAQHFGIGVRLSEEEKQQVREVMTNLYSLEEDNPCSKTS